MNIGSISAELSRLSQSQSYLVAYSGGVDSHVLLHLVAMLRDQLPDIHVRAMHVHHGLSPSADEWALHCKQVCDALAIPFLCEKQMVTTSGEGWEAAARRERYHRLARNLQAEECLLTAHTQDDQAETILLQLLRGAGPKGLAGMPRKKPFAHSLHLRPFLSVTRDEILAYAKLNQLSWVEDESNKNPSFDRNYLRHFVVPLLKRRWPATIKTLSRSAWHCGQTAELLFDIANDDLLKVQGSRNNTLSITALLQQSKLRRTNILRHWFLQEVERPPSTQQLEQLEKDVLRCDSNANPIFLFENRTLRRYRDDLYLVKTIAIDTDFEMEWDCQSALQLPGDLGKLNPEDFSHFKQLTVRFRRGGETFKPRGSQYNQSLKKLFQQWGVPPWERSRIPLLFERDRLVAVIGYSH